MEADEWEGWIDAGFDAAFCDGMITKGGGCCIFKLNELRITITFKYSNYIKF